MMKHPLDDQLSEAQRTLRDGYHDYLARAIADARNLLNGAVPGQRGEALVSTVTVHATNGRERRDVRMLLVTRHTVDVGVVISRLLPEGFRVESLTIEPEIVAPTGFILR